MTGADRDLSGLERIIKAFANRRRLGIVRHLKKNKEATVGDIADAIKLSFKATSKHLAILSAAGIVEREQRSLQMFYKNATGLPVSARTVISIL